MATFTNPIERERDQALQERGLPQIAYVENKSRLFGVDAPLIAIRRGERCFYPIHSRLSADELNALSGVTPAQREAMLCGSMFGWHLPGSDPAFHRPLLDRQATHNTQKGGAA